MQLKIFLLVLLLQISISLRAQDAFSMLALDSITGDATNTNIQILNV